MFTWAKELLSPSVQTGKPVNGSDLRRKIKLEDGEMTEEGFVCVGKSSFYKSPEMPAVTHSQEVAHSGQLPSQVLATFHDGPSTLYPALPHHQGHNATGTYNPTATLSVPEDHYEFLLRIPFTMRSGLSMGFKGGCKQPSQNQLYSAQFRTNFKEKYDYNFNLERGVINEMTQQTSGR
ncbi:unnamed protein product [Orchesella dallaii]|uniref:Uncharacterized protein n=1 Tax=Orchesella dallaii TaxID=48710 RepID=A0ABP1RU46_9HEXA